MWAAREAGGLLVDDRIRRIVSPFCVSREGIRLAAFGIGATTGTT